MGLRQVRRPLRFLLQVLLPFHHHTEDLHLQEACRLSWQQASQNGWRVVARIKLQHSNRQDQILHKPPLQVL